MIFQLSPEASEGKPVQVILVALEYNERLIDLLLPGLLEQFSI